VHETRAAPVPRAGRCASFYGQMRWDGPSFQAPWLRSSRWCRHAVDCRRSDGRYSQCRTKPGLAAPQTSLPRAARLGAWNGADSTFPEMDAACQDAAITVSAARRSSRRRCQEPRNLWRWTRATLRSARQMRLAKKTVRRLVDCCATAGATAENDLPLRLSEPSGCLLV